MEIAQRNRSFILIFVAFGTLMTLMAFLKYYSLHSSVFDLGMIIHAANDVFRRGMASRMFDYHAYFFIPVHGILSLTGSAGPYLFILIQTLACLTGVYLYFRSLPENKLDFRWAIVALLYAPLWYNVLFDVRWEHLFVLLCGLFYLLANHDSTRNRAALLGVGILACLVKEPFALSVFFMGIYLLVKRGKEIAFTAIFLMVFSLTYFFCVQMLFIPYFTEGHRAMELWERSFGHLGTDFKEMVMSLLKNPFQIITETVSNPGKLFYLLFLFGPFCFIPLLGFVELIPAIPLILISLISRDPNHYGYAHQYTAGLIIPMIAAFIAGIGYIKQRFSKTLYRRVVYAVFLSTALFHVLLSPSPLSRLFVTDKVWSYGWRAYIPTDRDAMIKQAILDHIPSDPAIAVSSQNTVNTYRLYNRDNFFSFPVGVTEPGLSHKMPENFVTNFTNFMAGNGPTMPFDQVYADYAVIDLKRPYYLNDLSCVWLFGSCKDKKMEKKFLAVFEETRRTAETVYENDGFYILRLQPYR